MRRTKEYEEFLMIIGEIMVEYSKAEVNSALIVSHMSGSRIGLTLFGNSRNADKKIQEYRNAVKKLQHDRREEFLVLLEKLDGCRKERNGFAHSIWNKDMRTRSMVGISSDRGTPKILYISNDEANRILKRITVLSGDISILFSELVIPNLKKGSINTQN
ncbi:MAG: hypothetical protein JJE09_00565 [Bacteroidia bacterium]|nr:hypothetical protein [Bacteroidia bacterium]